MSMVGNGSFMENWVSDELFGEIMNYCDFPMESFDGGGDWCNEFQIVGQIDSEYLHGNGTFDALPSDLVTDDKNTNLKQHPNVSGEPSKSSITLQNDSSNDLKVDEFQALGPVTYGLKSDLQANNPISVSNCLHSGLSQAPSLVSISVGSNSGLFQAPSPVSVLESTQSCSGENTILPPSETSLTLNTRSKRIRKTTYKTRFDMEEPVKRKPKKKKKLSQLLCDTEMKDGYSCSNKPAATKKCTHCKVTKTPQWREGPMGPKTLCNACGVRYRSGRLLPEYRPAASPTFVPFLHSNSHRKVVEMRKNGSEVAPISEMLCAISGSSKTKMESAAIPGSGMAKKESATLGCAISPPPEFVPMSSYLFD